MPALLATRSATPGSSGYSTASGPDFTPAWRCEPRSRCRSWAIRAWDAVIRGVDWRRPVEAETVLDDIQALERRLALKVRDGGVDGVILVIADTPRNRRALAAAPGRFSGFDRNARRVLSALAAGRDPGGSSLILL
jgi:hypothetical protein